MLGRVFKRGDIWWVAFSCKGKEYLRSAKSPRKSDAQTLWRKYLGQVADGTFTGFHEDRLFVHELLDDHLEDFIQRGGRSADQFRSHIKPLRERFNSVKATDLTERQIDLYIKHRLELGKSRTTINREMQALGQAFRLAAKKKLIDCIPHIPKFRENNARQGFFEKEEFERVMSVLPNDLRDFTRFAFLSGWRKSEIANLEWRDIEADVIRLRPQISKTHEGQVLVLVGELQEIIERRRAARCEHVPFVFHRKGVQVRQFAKSWRTACSKAGVPGKLFHDLRRTAVRNMVRAGVSEKVAMSISGHCARSIFDRYNIVNEEDIQQGLLWTQQYLESDGKGSRTNRIGQNSDS